ncbi:MAG: YkgJ family cysteine cluster protein [Chloroflexia bacterium]
MASPCADCTLGCCKHYTVTVTGYDMWVIARGLNMAPEQFMVIVPQTDASNRGFILDDTGRTFNIALDKRRSDAYERPCTFWLEMPGGVGRCGIYGLRPYVCQTYPANFIGSTEVHRREDVLCAPDAWRDQALKRPIWRERLLRMYVEYDIYALAVSRWNYHVLNTMNRQHIGHLGYYTFLMKYYERLEAVRAKLGEEGWLAMCGEWAEGLMKNTSPVDHRLEGMEPWMAVVDEICAIAADFFHDDLVEPAIRQREVEAVVKDA